MTSSPIETAPVETVPIETVYVKAHSVACDGGGGPLGHPLVYLTLDAGHGETGQGGFRDCPYCGRRYISDNSDV